MALKDFINEKFSVWYRQHGLDYLFHHSRGTYKLPNFLVAAKNFLEEEKIELSNYDKGVIIYEILNKFNSAAPSSVTSYSWNMKFPSLEKFQEEYINFFKVMKEDFKVPFSKLRDEFQAEFLQISYRYLSDNMANFLKDYPLLGKGSKALLAQNFYSNYNPFHDTGYSLYTNDSDYYYQSKPNYYNQDDDSNKDRWESYQIDQNKLNEEVQKFEKVFSFKPNQEFMEKITTKILNGSFSKRGALMIMYFKSYHNYILTDTQAKTILSKLNVFDDRIGEMLVDTKIYNHTIIKYKNPEKALKILGVTSYQYDKVYKDRLGVYLEKLKLEKLFESLDAQKKEKVGMVYQNQEKGLVEKSKETGTDTTDNNTDIVEEVKPKKRNKI